MDSLAATLDRITDFAKEHLVELVEWNYIPYGIPGECHPRLLVILDGAADLTSVLQQALDHVMRVCCNETKTILIYVAVGHQKWWPAWQKFEPYFADQEDRGVELNVRFRS